MRTIIIFSCETHLYYNILRRQIHCQKLRRNECQEKEETYTKEKTDAGDGGFCQSEN